MTDVEADGSVTASRDGDVLRLTLDRPSRRNALSHSMIDALVDLLTEAATDDSLRAIHIRGAGSDFCAGADWMATNSAGHRPRTGDLVRRIPHTANRVIELIHAIQLPVACTVRGWAVRDRRRLAPSRTRWVRCLADRTGDKKSRRAPALPGSPCCSPEGIRTLATAVRGRRPRPLDDGALETFELRIRTRQFAWRCYTTDHSRPDHDQHHHGAATPLGY